MTRVFLAIAISLVVLSSAVADVVGPPPCDPQPAPAIEVTLDCASTVFPDETVTILATAYDRDSCLMSGPGLVDTVDKFTWYIKVTCDDVPTYADDTPVTAETLISVQPMPEPLIQAVAAAATTSQGQRASQLDVGVNQPVYFDGGESLDRDSTGSELVDDSISSYSWDFGDDDTATVTTAVTDHTYSSAGTYKVSLVADDQATVYDDIPSVPAQVTVRVFADVPSAPTIVEPEANAIHMGLSPVVRWSGETHDQYEVNIGEVIDPDQPDDPNVSALWESGPVVDPVSEAQCPVALNESKLYYVFVREHNILGWGEWSDTGHRFTVLDDTQPPTNESVEPHADQNGVPFYTNTRYLFSAIYSDHCGYANIRYADLTVGDQSSCLIRFDSDDGCCWLLDDDGTTWLGGEGFGPGADAILENSQVAIHLIVSTVGGTDSDMTAIWDIEFKDGFTGAKPVALAVTNYRSLSDPDAPENFGVIHIVPDSGPSSLISSPTYCEYKLTRSISVAGTASDVHGVQKVEISTDGGTTWGPATGTTNWTYSWTPSEDGVYTIKSRATDVNDDVETPGTGTLVYVAADGPTSTIDSPVDGENIHGDFIVVRGTATSAPAKITRVDVSFDDGVNWVQANGAENFS